MPVDEFGIGIYNHKQEPVFLKCKKGENTVSSIEKVIALQKIKAESFDARISPAQKQYYLDVANWLESQNFSSAEESVEAMKNTPYYLGGTEAKLLDDTNLRIKAMEEVGYEEVAQIHRQRKEKTESKGAAVYSASNEWMQDLAIAQNAANKYARIKEIFGKIVSGYFTILCNPQSAYRKDAENDIAKSLSQLSALGMDFDDLARDPAYIKMSMLTPAGMEKFIQFIEDFKATGTFAENDISHLKDQQTEIGNWAKEHAEELIAVGKQELWQGVNFIAVPSESESGYEFIEKREVAL